MLAVAECHHDFSPQSRSQPGDLCWISLGLDNHSQPTIIHISMKLNFRQAGVVIDLIDRRTNKLPVIHRVRYRKRIK